MVGRAEAVRRYGALLRAVWRARRGPFDPFKLTWIVTEECSLRCRTCHLWATDPHAGPDLDTVSAVLEANPQLTWLNLSGGDLVERADAPALLERVATRGRDLALVDFPTAGQDTTATLAALEPLLDSPIPRIYVTVSLDGPDHVHDRVRGRRGAAARARATLAALIRLRRPGFRAVAGLTLSSHNLPADGAPLALADILPEGLAPEDLHVNLAWSSGHYYRVGKDVEAPAERALGVLEALSSRRRAQLSPLEFIERRYWQVARRYLTTGATGVTCGALRAAVFLAADLTVYPCSIFDRPLGRLDAIGYALRRIPEFEGAAEALGLVEQGRCPNCWSPCEAFPTLLMNLGGSGRGRRRRARRTAGLNVALPDGHSA